MTDQDQKRRIFRRVTIEVAQDGRDFYFAEPLGDGHFEIGELVGTYPGPWIDDLAHGRAARAWLQNTVAFTRRVADVKFV